jgi:hypothetical protein
MQVSNFYYSQKKLGFQGGYNVNIGAGQNKDKGGFNTGVNGKSLGVQEMKTRDQFPETLAMALKPEIENDSDAKVWIAAPGALSKDEQGSFINIPNIKGENDKLSVGKIYLSQIQTAIKKVNPDAEVKVTNDGLMQAVTDLRNDKVRGFLDENLSEGEGAFVRFGAGGCGGYKVTKTDEGYELKPAQTGHLVMPDKEINTKYVIAKNNNTLITKNNEVPESIESYSACAPAALRIFALELGFSPENAMKIANTVEGRIVTKDVVKLDRNDEEQAKQSDALKKLAEEGLFKHEQKDDVDEYTLISPKTGEPITHEERVNGLKAASTEYFKGIGVMLADGACHLATTIALTAGFDSHLAKATREDAGLNPEQIIKETAFRNIDGERKTAIGSSDGFKVLIQDTGEPSDPKNAELMLGKGKIVGDYHYGVIPYSALNN